MVRNVRMPNGTLVRNVPDNISREEFLNRLGSAGYNVDELLTPAQRAEAAKPVTPPAPKPAETKPEEAPEEGRAWYGLSKKGLTEGFGTQLAEGAKQGIGGVRQAAIDALPDSIDQLPPGLTYEEVDRVGGVRAYWEQVYGIKSNEQLKAIKQQATSRLKEERQASEARVAAATPEDLTLLETGIRSGSESIVRNLPGIAASIATRNPLPALASAGLQTGVESYGEARAEGLTPGQASRYAGIDAAIEVGTELLPTKFLLGAFGAKSLNGVKGQLLRFAAGEMTGEQIATATQSLNAYLNDLDKELAAAKTPEEMRDILARRAALTGIATLVSGGTLALGATAAGAIAERRSAREEPPIPEELPTELEPEITPPFEAPAAPREVAPELRGIAELEVPPEVIEGVPPAVIDSAKDILSLADQGKPIILFQAKSLVRQLGVDLPKNANKETTLTALREALALTAVPQATEAAPVEVPETMTMPIAEAPPVETARPKLVNPFLTPEALAETGLKPEVTQEPETVLTELTASNLDEVQSIFSGLQTGDKIVNDMGDEFVVGDIIRAKRNGPIVAVLDAQTNQPLKVEEVAGLLLPSPYTDASTGERKLSGAGKVIKTAASEAVPTIKEAPSESVRDSVGEVVDRATPRGAELPVQRGRPAGPEVTEPAVSGLEPVSTAAPRVDEGKAVEPTALETVRPSQIASDVERDLRTKSRKEEQPGDVMMETNGQFVPLKDVVEAARAVMSPEQQRMPAQYGRMLDIAARDWSRVVKAVTEETTPTEQRFLNLDRLNAETLAVPEQTKEKAPSLRRELSKAKSQYDVGKMTADDFANRAGQLLLKTQKERVIQPRQRGAEFIRERLFNAVRRGELPAEGVELAAWFIQQNPALVADLGISITKRPESMEGIAGYYNDATRVIKLFKEAIDPDTATHEIMHHLERLMPANIRAGIYKAYTRQLLKAQKNAKTPAEKAFFEALVSNQFGQLSDFAYQKALQDIKDGKVSRDNYQYVNPSEFWAVNGTRIVQGRYGVPPTITGQLKRWLREFLEKVKSVLGLKSDAAIIRALDSLAKADGKYQTSTLLMEAPAYRSIQPPRDLYEVRKKATEQAKGPSVFQQAWRQFEGHGFYQNLVKKFADITEPIMKLDREKDRAGYLITMGPDRNNIASELVRSPNITDFIITRRVEPVERQIQNAIKNYARIAGMSVEDAVNKLDGLMIAIHEKVRRETNYLRNVGLRNDIRLPAGSLPFAENQPAMTPADYREYLEELRSKLPPDQAERIQDVMRVVVDKFKTPRGFSPKTVAGKPTPTDINDKFYDVIPRKIEGVDAYTPQFLKQARDEYANLDPETRAAVDEVRSGIAEIHELERQLGRESNYWSPQVDSVVASYQWGDTYVPFQGIPNADGSLDYSSKKLSGELTQTAQAWDGRSTDFDSPILQSIYNAKRAAGRVGRKDLISTTIVNNIKQGFLRAKSTEPKKYSFDVRRAPDFDFEVLQGANKILDYQPNGDVHVYELKESDKLDALKGAYHKFNPKIEKVLDKASMVTGWFAQYHTRFNIAFSPMDFFTNTMTNLGLISTGKGGTREGARYIAQTLSNVARSGLFTKSANLSRALSSKDPAVLDKLMRSSDPFYSEAMDFLRLGGRSLYRQALGVGVQLEELVSAVGPSRIVKTRQQVARMFDMYNDAFEFTARLAAYTTHLKDITAKAKLNNIDVNNPEVQEALKREATTFALELMNFRKMGEYGRFLSSLYMFFKPGATSAKLAYDAVRKGLVNAESALKNADPTIWAKLNSKYELAELEAEQAKPRPDSQKITELQNAISANNEAKQKFIDNYNQERKNAAIAIPLFFATGAVYYAIAQMFSPDDDEGRNRIATDEMSRWVRYARMPIPGSEDFFQLPWGYGVGAFAAAGAQTSALIKGNVSLSDYAGNMLEIALDSFMPIPASRINPMDNFGAWLFGTIMPSSARGFVEYTLNMDSQGNPIYNSRLGKYADAYSGTARPGELHNWMSDTLFGLTKGIIDWSPNSIAYALNTYADGPNVLAERAFGLALALKGDKEIDLKKDVPIFKRFVGRMSNFDAREFSEAERWIKDEARTYKTFRDIRPAEEYDEYVENHPSVPVISAMYDDVLNGTLSELAERRNLIMRDRELTPKERKELLDDVDYNINATKRNFVESYKAIREEEEEGG
jgi:Large polyvalent protein associated domain 38